MPIIHLSNSMVMLLAACVLCSGNAAADPRSANAKPASAVDIRSAFSGKSWRWKAGGAYHARNGKLVAVLSEGVIGNGRWSVSSKDTLCHTATWRWNKTAPKQRRVTDCWKHVVDQNGKLCQHDKRVGWYRFPARQISVGDRYSARATRLKHKIAR